MESDICRRCGAVNSKIVNPVSGEEVCDNCGLVYEDKIIDETYEKRNFSQENSGGNRGTSRVGGPLKATDTLGTNIVFQSGNFQKLRTNTINCKTSKERGFEEISNFLGGKEIPQMMIEETKKIYDEVTKDKKMKGRNMKYVIAAMYFIACRTNGLSKSFKDIAQILSLEEKKIKKSYNFIKRIVAQTVLPDEFNNIVKNYIKQFCEENRVDKKVENLACEIATRINNSNVLDGRSPQTISGFSLSLAIKLIPENKITLKDICIKFAKEKTLDNVNQKVKNNLETFIPEEYHDKLAQLTK